MATHLHTDLLGLSEQRSRPSKLQASSDGNGDAFRRALSAPSEKSGPEEAGASAGKPSGNKPAAEDRNAPGEAALEHGSQPGGPEKPPTEKEAAPADAEMLAARDALAETAVRPAAPPSETDATASSRLPAEDAAKTVRIETKDGAEVAARLDVQAEKAVVASEAEVASPRDAKPDAASGKTEAALLPAKASAEEKAASEAALKASASDKADAPLEAGRRPEESNPHADRRTADKAAKAIQGDDAIKISAPAAEAGQASTIRHKSAQSDPAATSKTSDAETVDIKRGDARTAIPAIDHPAPSASTASDSAFSISSDIKSVERLVASGDGLNSQGGETATFTASAAPASTPAGATTQTANVQFMQAMRAQAPMIATPAEITEIIQTRLAGSDGGDRITVQLDPPELGRVSIDFKFDAQGLQHITITGETPEALKQLRQVHFQLTQALEQQGLSGQDMTFRQQSFGQQQNQQDPSGLNGFSGPTGETLADTITHAAMQPSRTLLPGGGLDMKL